MKIMRRDLRKLICESVNKKRLIKESGYEEAWELILMSQEEIKRLVEDHFGLRNIDLNDPAIDEFCRKLGSIIDEMTPSVINWFDLRVIAWDGDNSKWLPIIDYYDDLGLESREIFHLAMEERDAGSNRQRQPGGIDALYDDVLSDEYASPVLLSSGGKMYAVGGRTRLFAAYAQRKEKIRVIIIKEDDLIRAKSLII